MSTLTCKFYLDGDERTYWTLLVHGTTRGADILQQVARKMQLKSPASLSLAALLRDDASGELARESLKPHDDVSAVAKQLLALDDAACKFVIFQKPDIALDEKLLSREVVLDADTLTPRGSLLLASNSGNSSSAHIKRRRRQKANTASDVIAPTTTTAVAAAAPPKEKGFADYEFSDDDDDRNGNADHGDHKSGGAESSSQPALSFRIRPHASTPQPIVAAARATGDSSESSSPVSMALPPPVNSSARRSRRNNPRPSSAQLNASGGSQRLGGDSTEDMLDDNADALLRLTPPKSSPVLARQPRRRAGTGAAAASQSMSNLTASTTAAEKPSNLFPVRSASGMPIFLDTPPKAKSTDDNEADDGSSESDDADDANDDDDDETNENQDGVATGDANNDVDVDDDDDDDEEEEEEEVDSALRRFCSHTLATRLSAERRSHLGGQDHRGRVPWIAQCCIERLMSKEALEARNLFDSDQVSLADVNTLAEQLHESASSGRYAATLEGADVRVVAALLFTYLQRLPDGVVPSTAFASFIDVDVREDESKRRESRLARLVRALPATNRALLGDIVHWAVLWAGHAPNKKLLKKSSKSAAPVTLGDVSAILAPIVLRAPVSSEFSAEQAATMVLHMLSEASLIVGAPFYGVGEQLGLPDVPLTRKVSDASEDLSQSVESYNWNPFIGAKFVYTYDPFEDEAEAKADVVQTVANDDSGGGGGESSENDDEVVPQITPPRPAPGARKRPNKK